MTRPKIFSLQARSKAIASDRLLGGVEYDGTPTVSAGSKGGVLMAPKPRRDKPKLGLVAPLRNHL